VAEDVGRDHRDAVAVGLVREGDRRMIDVEDILGLGHLAGIVLTPDATIDIAILTA